MNDEALRAMPVFEVGYRTALIKGCDYRILVLIGCLCFAMMFVWTFNFWIDLFVIPLGFLFFKGGQMMGKADEKMFDVWQRALTYKQFYFAKAYAGSPCNKNYTRPWK